MKSKIVFLAFLLLSSMLLPFVAVAEEDASREEIVEMCKKAETLLLTNKEAGIAEIANKEGQFVWKNTYVFLMDLDGNMLAHPMIPQLTEKGPLFHVADKNPDKPKMIFVEFVDIARKNGEGWIWYMWPKPNSREPVDKFTYIRRVGFTNMLVGAGIYK
ncbi:MAG: cache domain-containing protein [Deltaproteobacteria bacterium]|jgi:signal transduction histidine kinase|nr:cache domain-containing protein [Deltaproteobacteria bacterium]